MDKIKCGLFVLLLGLSSIALSIVYSDNTSAQANWYDDIVSISDGRFGDTTMFQAFQTTDGTCKDDVNSLLMGDKNNTHDYAVIDDRDIGSIPAYRIFYTEHKNRQDSGFYFDNASQTIMLNRGTPVPNNQTNVAEVYYYNDQYNLDCRTTSDTVLWGSFPSLKILGTTYNVYYPDDYNGVLIPHVSGGSQSNHIKPQFDWDVSRRDITLTLRNPFEHDDYQYFIQVNYIGSLSDDIDGINYSDTQNVHKAITDLNSTHRFSVTKNGYYILGVAIVEKGSSVDDDNSVIIQNTGQKWLQLKIDGSFYSGTTDNTDELVCHQDTLNGQTIERCVAAAQIDCSTIYDGDLILGFGCELKNSFLGFMSFIRNLVTPNFTTWRSSFDLFWSQFQQSFGFLAYPAVLITDVYTNLINPNTNVTGTTCNIGSFSFFGSTPNAIHLCKWRQDLPQLWSIMQIAIQGGIVISLSFAYWRKFNAIFGRNVDEHDETDDISNHPQLQGHSSTYSRSYTRSKNITL